MKGREVSILPRATITDWQSIAVIGGSVGNSDREMADSSAVPMAA
jgi:hypothetical protein